MANWRLAFLKWFYNVVIPIYFPLIMTTDFFTIAEAIQNPRRSDRRIIARPQINQFRRIRITARYLRNSFVLAKFQISYFRYFRTETP